MYNTLAKKRTPAQIVLFLLFGLVLGISVAGVSNLSNRGLIVALIGLSFPFIALIIGDIRRVLMSAIVFTIPIRIDINVMNKFENQAGASTLGISLTDIILIVLLIWWLIEVVSNDNIRIRYFARIIVPAILYLEACMLTLLWAPRMDLASMELVQMAKVLLLFFVLANQIRNQSDLKLIIWAFVLTVGFESLIAVLQTATGHSLSLGFLGEAEKNAQAAGRLWRVGGTLGHPNRLAMFLELLLPLCLGLVFWENLKWKKLIAFAVFGMGVISLISTGSRGGWIGLMFSMVILFYYLIVTKRVQTRSIIGPVLISVIILSVIGYYSSEMIERRLTGDDYGSAESRIPMFKTAFALIADKPVGGVGINNYQVVMKKYNTAVESLRYKSIDRPVHNMYLLILGESGFIGFITFGILTIYLFFIVIKAIRSPNKIVSIVSMCLYGGFFAFYLHGLVDKHPPGGYSLFYAMMAIAASGYYFDDKSNDTDSLLNDNLNLN